MEWSILFMGPVGAGKTQAIQTISEIDVVSTDMRASDETATLKSHTTVSMDVGTLHLGDNDKLRLYGSPGQDRFDFMWDILLMQSKGVILTLNHASADPIADLNHYLKALETRTAARKLPVVLGITHTDEAPERNFAIYQDHLSAHPSPYFNVPPPVLTMDARNPHHVRIALMAVTAKLEMEQRFGSRLRARKGSENG